MAGIDGNHDDDDGYHDDDLPPLLQAAKDGDPAAFKKLLLDDDTDVLIKDKDGRTALHWAAHSGSVPIILAGVAKGLGWHIDAKNMRGMSPLHDACLSGHRKVVHLLIAIGADLVAQTQEGYTPLLCAAGSGYSDVTRILIGAGCDGNRLIQPMGINALHIAAWTGHSDVIDTLLELGCRADEPSKTGKTALEFAIQQRHTECMEILNGHTKQAGSKDLDESKVLKSRMRRMESKIRDIYGTKLQEEIVYFEKQLQEQHARDKGIILSLQEEVRRLHLVLGDDHGGHPGSRRRSSSTANVMTVGNEGSHHGGHSGRRRSSSTANVMTVGNEGSRLLTQRQSERSRRLRQYSSRSTSESSDRSRLSGNYSDLEFDDDDDAFDDHDDVRHHSDTLSPGFKMAAASAERDNPIHELTEVDSRKRAAEAVMRRQFSSPDGVQPIPPNQRTSRPMSPINKSHDVGQRSGSLHQRERTGSSSSSQRICTPVPPSTPSPREQSIVTTHQTPMRKISEAAPSHVALTTEQHTLKSRRKGFVAPNQPSSVLATTTITPSNSSHVGLPAAPSDEETPIQEITKSRRRRSIADIIFPFKRKDDQTTTLFKRRHRSVVTKSSTPPSAPTTDNSKQTNKGLSLLQAPLPGIPNNDA